MGDTPWDYGGAAPPLLEFLSHHAIRGAVLVPGCGSGHDVRALAAQGAEVTGLDLSETALRIARISPLLGMEIYEQRDLFHLPAAWSGRFDWVVEHTCFCAILPERRMEYVRAIARTLKSGGCYLGIFFLTPDAQQGPPHGTTREEIEALFNPSLALLEEWVPEQVFQGREGCELCQLRRTL